MKNLFYIFLISLFIFSCEDKNEKFFSENGWIKSWGFHGGDYHYFNEDGSKNKNGVIPF